MKQSRWQLRFEHYEKAMQRLTDAVKKETYTELEAAGLVQTFEFTFELGWKTLKDLLQQEGFSALSPRAVIKHAYQIEFIQDGHIWLDALEKRNLLAHIYDEDECAIAIQLIKDKYFPMLQNLLTYLKNRADK